jgi:molecular chaperone DnaK
MIVGIDLGTSTSEVAILRNGKPELIREVRGSNHGILPSVVGIGSNGQLQYGEFAASLLIAKPGFATEEIKRKMGTAERLQLGGEEYTPQELSAMIIHYLKCEAERHVGELVTEVVVTVPAYFTAIERQATRDAGELAGLTVRRLINEPTAAALAYGIERPGVEEKVVVYDLGGGTLDVTVLELSEGVLDVLASKGNSRLGGKDFDERLMVSLRDRCLSETGVDLMVTPRLRQRLKTTAKKTKEDLSSLEEVQVLMTDIGLAPDGRHLDFECSVTREGLEELIRDLVESTRRHLDEALAVKQLTSTEISTILMIGGSTRIPLVRAFVSDYFGGRQLRTEVGPDEAVALGAAVLAGIEDRSIEPERIVITDVSPWTLGVEVSREIGDTIYAGFFDKLIPAQSTLPRTAKNMYQTLHDWQESVHVKVFQGDAPRCEDNVPVGDFLLDQILPEPAGAPIEIEFSYNLSNELDVVARAVSSGREVRARLRPGANHLSGHQKESAAQRLAKLWGRSDGARPAASERPAPRVEPMATPPSWQDSPFYSQVAALITHAERRLGELDPTSRARVTSLLDLLRAALGADDATAIKKYEEQLTDTLFDLE